MEYVKDRTENFDDYYPCKNKPDCNFNHHVYHWFMLLFILLYNLSKLSPNSINYLIGGDNLTGPSNSKANSLVGGQES